MTKLAPHLKECDAFNSLPKDTTPGTDLFLKNFTEPYKNVPEVSNSLAVAHVRAIMVKASPSKNVYYDERLMNLLRYLNGISGKCDDVVAANLAGPSKLWIQKLNRHNGQSVYLIAQQKLFKGEYGTS